MTNWTWPLVVVVSVLILAIATMFSFAENADIQTQLIEYFDTIVPFVVGAAAGGAVGGTFGFGRGKGLF